MNKYHEMRNALPSLFKKGIGFFLLFQYTIDVDTTKNSDISLTVGGGTGSYVVKDCSGKTIRNVPFYDAGVSLDYYKENVRFGVKTGIVSVTDKETKYNNYPTYSVATTEVTKTAAYITPNIGINSKYFGLDIGVLIISEDQNIFDRLHNYNSRAYLSGELRIGRKDGFYVNFGLLNNTPVWSGGGAFDIGMGYDSGPQKAKFWWGIGFSPYEMAISTKIDLPISKKHSFLIKAQLGLESFQGGISLGGKILF